jgi:hypothetical protein
MTDDHDLPMNEYRRAGLEITRGNPEVYKSLWSRRDDVTLANGRSEWITETQSIWELPPAGEFRCLISEQLSATAATTSPRMLPRSSSRSLPKL